MSKSPTLKELMSIPLDVFKDLTPIRRELHELTAEYCAVFGQDPIRDVQVLWLGDEEYLRRMKRVIEMRDESLWYEGLPELPPDALI